MLSRDKVREELFLMQQKAIEMRTHVLHMRELSTKIRENTEKIKNLIICLGTLKSQVPVKPLHQLSWGKLDIDTATFEANYNKYSLNLTEKEFKLIKLLVQNGHQVLKPSHIFPELWYKEKIPKQDTIKAHIKHLRKKLITAGAPDNFIETVHGVGYRLKDNP